MHMGFCVVDRHQHLVLSPPHDASSQRDASSHLVASIPPAMRIATLIQHDGNASRIPENKVYACEC